MLMNKIRQSLKVRYDETQGQMESLERRVKTVSEPEIKSALTGITQRVQAARNLDSIEDKQAAQN